MPENLKNAADKKASHRIIAYVDGYNLYCAVNKWAQQHPKNLDLVKYDLWKLVRCCLKKIKEEIEDDDLKEIKFYTAQPRKKGHQYSRKHFKEWTEWQKKERGIDVIKGYYQNGKFKEKQSDVNLSVDMLWDAFPKPGDESEIPYDTAVLVSNDTDYCRLVWRCLKLKKQVFILSTKCDYSIKDELCKNTSSSSEPYSSKCKKYIDDGMLKFYQINKEDIWKYRDEEYIAWTRENQSNKKKRKKWK